MLAGEAYSQQLPKLRRTLVPMYSLIVLTEPLAESDWDQIGWRNRELRRLVAACPSTTSIGRRTDVSSSVAGARRTACTH